MPATKKSALLAWQQKASAEVSTDTATVVAAAPRHLADFAAALGSVLRDGVHRFRIVVRGAELGVRVGVAQESAALDDTARPSPPIVGYDGQGITLSSEGVASYGWLPAGMHDDGARWDGAKDAAPPRPPPVGSGSVTRSSAWALNLSDGAIYFSTDARAPGAFLHPLPEWQAGGDGEQTFTMVVDMKSRTLAYSTEGGPLKDAGVVLPAAVKLWGLLPAGGASVTLASHERLAESAAIGEKATGEGASRWLELKRSGLSRDGAALATTAFSAALPRALQEDVRSMFREANEGHPTLLPGRAAAGSVPMPKRKPRRHEEDGLWIFSTWTELECGSKSCLSRLAHTQPVLSAKEAEPTSASAEDSKRSKRSRTKR